MAFIDALSEWIATEPPLKREPAVLRAREAFADIAGCLLAGAADEAPQRVLAAVRSWGSGPASVVGEAEGLAAPWAALVNGTAAHALDFDDNFHPQAGHATAAMAPALLALGEEREASGFAVLDAYIAGLEALGRISEGLGLAHYERGWHSTSTLGAIGVAAACARLLGLDVARTRAAISIGFSTAAGSKLQFGTMAKPMHAGLAACHGVMAARLAETGVTATHDPLEPAWGLCDLFGAGSSPGFQGLEARLGRPLAIEEFGLKTKVHPNCASAHAAIDGVLDLRAEHGFENKDIDRVETVIHTVGCGNLRYGDPKTELEARFSMPYAIALALLYGRLTLADFRPEAVRRPEVRAWYPRIHVRPPEPNSALMQIEPAHEPAEAIVHLRNGRSLRKVVTYAKGVPERPMSDDERATKLADCAAGVLDRGALKTLKTVLDRLDSLDRVDTFTRLLRFKKDVAARAAS
ncbi:MAG: MmgE/PrpD family protein [Rhodospirillales bacterium]|nr:MmgE/PrpD family protein [Rhodospirillales bacterium]